jgi:hypothetical protein
LALRPEEESSLTEEQVAHLCNAAITILGPNADDVNTVHLLTSSLLTILNGSSPERQTAFVVSIMRNLNAIRKPIFDPRCCSSCVDGNEIVDALISKLAHVEAPVALRSLAHLFRGLLDSTRDDDLAEDIGNELAEILFPTPSSEEILH